MKKDFSGLSTLMLDLSALQEEKDLFLERASRTLAQAFLREVKRRTPVGKPPEFDTVEVTSYSSQTVRRKAGNGQVTYQRKVKRKREMLTASAARASEFWKGYQGGTLRRAWIIRGIRKKGDLWTATIINPTAYASYVEYGHRQRPGRFVPALGKRLKHSWVKGHFMMTLSAAYIERDGAPYIQREFEAYLRRHWSGK